MIFFIEYYVSICIINQTNTDKRVCGTVHNITYFSYSEFLFESFYIFTDLVLVNLDKTCLFFVLPSVVDHQFLAANDIKFRNEIAP